MCLQQRHVPAHTVSHVAILCTNAGGGLCPQQGQKNKEANKHQSIQCILTNICHSCKYQEAALHGWLQLWSGKQTHYN